MQYSTIVVASLLAAVASAEHAFPAKRSFMLAKRAGACGDSGECCGQVGGLYAACPTGSSCGQYKGAWCCCPSGKTCPSCQDDSCKSGLYGKDYTCTVVASHAVYAPSSQAAEVAGVMATAAASSIAAEGSAVASSISAAVSSALAGATETEAAPTGTAAPAPVAPTGTEAAPTGTEAAPTGTEGAATGTEAPASASGTQPPAPAVTGAANKLYFGTPALVVALVGGVFIL